MRAALLVVVVIAAACFSERGSGPATGAAECSVPVTVIDSMHYLIAIRDFSFHPDSLTVPVGATVTWVNCETPPQEPHTTTSDSSVWASPELSPGSRFSHTFPAAGGFPYHCTPHPFMTGKIEVQ
ncbi:MAG TPA: cupredoxin family copper-binding protein [Gemmatimonadales bacterium]|jgi:plastocyanin|nr:cupredoxin family copper-binding protein [Gemmatimonadales bacterium]